MPAVRSFQSTPVIANGRIGGGAEGGGASGEFQSTPVIANGRIQGCCAGGRGSGLFNPRPLLLAGESGEGGDGKRVVGVSIHARYC